MTDEKTFGEYARIQLSQGRVFTYVARGQSMRPWIPDGSVVTIGPMDSPRIGDVVLAMTSEGPILHRLLRLNKEGGLLAGDLNTSTQDCTLDDMIGVALECTIPDGTRRSLRNPLFNWVLLLAFAPVRLRKSLKNPLHQ